MNRLSSKLFFKLFICFLYLYFISKTTAALKIITKSEWHGEEALGELNVLQSPAQRVIILHTTGADCTQEESCAQLVRNIQAHHLHSSNFDDIAYSFLIGNDGNVYEGRGWTFQGAFARGYNADSIGIAFIGTYVNRLPNAAALTAVKELIAESVRLEKLVPNYKIIGHRQVQPTESPGAALFREICTWPHWSATP